MVRHEPPGFCAVDDMIDVLLQTYV